MSVVEYTFPLLIRLVGDEDFVPYSEKRYTQKEALDICLQALKSLPVGTKFKVVLSEASAVLYTRLPDSVTELFMHAKVFDIT